MGSVPESRRSPGDGNGKPLQFSCLGSPMDREAWQSMGSQRVGHDLETKQQQFINTYIDLKFWILCQLSYKGSPHIFKMLDALRDFRERNFIYLCF